MLPYRLATPAAEHDALQVRIRAYLSAHAALGGIRGTSEVRED